MKRLNLGCGNKPLKNAINHDLVGHRPEVDTVWDLNDKPWPWDDNSFDLVVAKSVFEHLEIDLVEALNECWRVLRSGGRLYVKVPHWQHDNAYADPTHRWRYSLRSFEVFDPSKPLGKKLDFYTSRKWTITEGPWLNSAKSSMHVKLEVQK